MTTSSSSSGEEIVVCEREKLKERDRVICECLFANVSDGSRWVYTHANSQGHFYKQPKNEVRANLIKMQMRLVIIDSKMLMQFSSACPAFTAMADGEKSNCNSEKKRVFVCSDKTIALFIFRATTHY
jgi:hypothetical protein